MKIYIASSWKNQHGVEMLTALLRDKGHEVLSWIENNFGEDHNHVTRKFSFEEWVTSPESDQSFQFDTDGATKSDLVIYYGPAGKDACAELGAAWAKGAPIIGIYAKGEDLGLMRKMVDVWVYRYTDLLEMVAGANIQFEQNRDFRERGIIDAYPCTVKSILPYVFSDLQNRNKKEKMLKVPDYSKEILHDEAAFVCLCKDCVSKREG